MMLPLVAVAILLPVYFLWVVLYRLYFSPISHIPGDKLAAITSWYNAYHDLVRGGQYVWVVEEMHRKYGPVVRVRPDAVHVADPRFIDTLYSQSPKLRRERYWTVTQGMQADGSILATVDHDMHRRRRGVLNPFFSQQNVRRLEPVIRSTLTDLFARMDGWADQGEPINMNRALRAATKDVIQAYALGEGAKCLEMEDCNAGFFDIITPQRVCHLGTHVFWLAKIMANLPPALMMHLIPRVAVFARWMEGLNARIEQIRSAKEHPENKTIFHEIMRSDQLPDSEKETKRLADEAMVIVIAGSETTASTLAAIIYHMLSDREALKRLKGELSEALADSHDSLPVMSRIETLPYLNALIQEALRLYPGATHRQDRLAPDEALVYRNPESGYQCVFPKGTAIGMTAPISNRYSEVYGSQADRFLPDRYLQDPRLRQYQFAFSKGTRQCIGMNLAYQELQMIVAGIFHRYDVYDPSRKAQSGPTLELFETDQRDIEMFADYVTPGQYPGSQGLRLRIRR